MGVRNELLHTIVTVTWDNGLGAETSEEFYLEPTNPFTELVHETLRCRMEG